MPIIVTYTDNIENKNTKFIHKNPDFNLEEGSGDSFFSDCLQVFLLFCLRMRFHLFYLAMRSVTLNTAKIREALQVVDCYSLWSWTNRESSTAWNGETAARMVDRFNSIIHTSSIFQPPTIRILFFALTQQRDRTERVAIHNNANSEEIEKNFNKLMIGMSY